MFSLIEQLSAAQRVQYMTWQASLFSWGRDYAGMLFSHTEQLHSRYTDAFKPRKWSFSGQYLWLSPRYTLSAITCGSSGTAGLCSLIYSCWTLATKRARGIARFTSGGIYSRTCKHFGYLRSYSRNSPYTCIKL